MTKAYDYLMDPERGWDGDARADGVREPAPPPGEMTQSGPDWGGYHWAASFYGLGEETTFDEKGNVDHSSSSSTDKSGSSENDKR